jgi:hypothetical protein
MFIFWVEKGIVVGLGNNVFCNHKFNFSTTHPIVDLHVSSEYILARDCEAAYLYAWDSDVGITIDCYDCIMHESTLVYARGDQIYIMVRQREPQMFMFGRGKKKLTLRYPVLRVMNLADEEFYYDIEHRRLVDGWAATVDWPKRPWNTAYSPDRTKMAILDKGQVRINTVNKCKMLYDAGIEPKLMQILQKICENT